MRGAGGFSLLEALVALVIVALVVSAGLRVFATGAEAGSHATRELALARYAEGLLARVDLDLEVPADGLSGEEGPFRWQIERLPYRDPHHDDRSERSQPKAVLMVLRVIVASAGGQSFVLESMRLVRP